MQIAKTLNFCNQIYFSHGLKQNSAFIRRNTEEISVGKLKFNGNVRKSVSTAVRRGSFYRLARLYSLGETPYFFLKVAEKYAELQNPKLSDTCVTL